jgi:hypothetical protein
LKMILRPSLNLVFFVGFVLSFVVTSTQYSRVSFGKVFHHITSTSDTKQQQRQSLLNLPWPTWAMQHK